MTGPDRPRATTFWITFAIGWACIAYGVRGALVDANATKPPQLLAWVLGAAVIHDAVLAPIALGIAWLMSRLLNRSVANAVKVGAATSALLVTFSWALVRGYGRRRSLPSALPLDYGRNLLITLAVIWIGIGIYIVVRSLPPRQRQT